jgi:putative heme transporter
MASPRLLFGLLLLVAIGYAVVRGHSTWSEITRVVHHFSFRRLPFLLICVVAEMLSFLCYALVQRNLLMEGGARLSRRTMVELAIAATGLTNLLPGGTAPASGWLVSQYRKRGIPMPLALWSVIAGGLAATLAILLLVVAGATIAGFLNYWTAPLCLVALGAGAVLVTIGIRQIDAVDTWFRSHHLGRIHLLLSRASKRLSQSSQIHASRTMSAKVLLLSVGNWGLDVACLTAAFPFLGLGIPWRAVLFAYAVAQVAGSVAPVPAGIGFVEGGMIGAFALAGVDTGPAILATLVYRLLTSVGMATVGSVMLLHISRKDHPEHAKLTQAAKKMRTPR